MECERQILWVASAISLERVAQELKRRLHYLATQLDDIGAFRGGFCQKSAQALHETSPLALEPGHERHYGDCEQGRRIGLGVKNVA